MALNKVYFTTNGTWTCPSNVTEILIIAAGGGGGGAGGGINGQFGGAGGGASAQCVGQVSTTPGAIYNIVIGAGGMGGAGVSIANVGNAGLPGNDTIFKDNNQNQLFIARGADGGSTNYIGGNNFRGISSLSNGFSSSSVPGGGGNGGPYVSAGKINFSNAGFTNGNFTGGLVGLNSGSNSGGGGGGAGPAGNGGNGGAGGNQFINGKYSGGYGANAANNSGAGGGGGGTGAIVNGVGLGGSGGKGGSGYLYVLYVTDAGGSSGTAGGDLSGSYPNPTVSKLQGNNVQAITLGPGQNGYVLTWNNGTGQWEAQAGGSGFTAAGDLSGSSASQTVIGIQGRPVSSAAPSATNVLEWNGSAWAPAALPTSLPPSGAASGDLSGTYPSPSVIKINGATVPASGSLTTGNVLQVNGISSLTYGPVNLAGGANYVSGNLPVGNIAPGTAGQIFISNATPTSAWTSLINVELTHGRFTAGGSGSDWKTVIGNDAGSETTAGAIYMLQAVTAPSNSNWSLAADTGNLYLNSHGTEILFYASDTATSLGAFATTSWLNNTAQLLFGAAVASPLFSQSAPAGATSAGQNLTITPQSGGATSGVPGSLVVNLFPPNGGSSEATGFVIQRSGVTRAVVEPLHGRASFGNGGTDTYAMMGPLVGIESSFAALYLLQNGQAATSHNYIVVSQGSNAYWNTPNVSGSHNWYQGDSTLLMQLAAPILSLTSSITALNFATSSSISSIGGSLSIEALTSVVTLDAPQVWFRDGTGAQVIDFTLAHAGSTTMQIQSGVTAFTLNQVAAASDVAPANITIQPQAPFGTAVTNLLAGDVIVNVPASIGAGVKNGGLKVTYNSTQLQAMLGSYNNNNGGALWLGLNAVAPDNTNWALYANYGGGVIVNSPAGNIQFRENNSTQLGTWDNLRLTITTAIDHASELDLQIANANVLSLIAGEIIPTAPTIAWVAGAVSPTITQAANATGAGQTMTIAAQDAHATSGLAGGTLTLKSGVSDGTSFQGALQINPTSTFIQAASTNSVEFTASVIQSYATTFQWIAGAVSPTITQVQAASGSGQTMLIAAQAAAAGSNGNGGNLNLEGGSKNGTGSDGYVIFPRLAGLGSGYATISNTGAIGFTSLISATGIAPGTAGQVYITNGTPASAWTSLINVELTHGRFTAGGNGSDFKAVIGPQVGIETLASVLYLLPNATSPAASNYAVQGDGTNLVLNTISATGAVYYYNANSTNFARIGPLSGAQNAFWLGSGGVHSALNYAIIGDASTFVGINIPTSGFFGVINANNNYIEQLAAGTQAGVVMGGSVASAGHRRTPSGWIWQSRNSTNTGDVTVLFDDGAGNLKLGGGSSSYNTTTISGATEIDILAGSVIAIETSAMFLDGSTITMRDVAHANTAVWTLNGLGSSSVLWAEGVTSFQLGYTPATSDHATHDFVISGQRAFATATGTNRTPGNLIFDIGSPQNSGTTEAFFKFTRQSQSLAQIGIDFSTTQTGLWLGAPGTTFTTNNVIVTSDASSFAYLNAPTAASAIGFVSANTNFLLYIPTTQDHLYLGSSTTTAPFYVDWSTSTTPIISSGTNATQLSVRTNKAGASLVLQQDAAITAWTLSGGNALLMQAPSTATSITINQANLTTASGTGATLTIQAQNETGTTSTGGNLNLTSGTGTTNPGTLNLQTGGTNQVSIGPIAGIITISLTPSAVQWLSTTTSPTLNQADTSGSTQNMTVRAQNTSSGAGPAGGNLNLSSGSSGVAGGTADGNVLVQTGGTTRITVAPAGITVGTSTQANSLVGSYTNTTRLVNSNPFTIDTTTKDYILDVDTSSAPTGITITLPAPTNGRTLILRDITGSFGTNNCTLAQHSTEKINGIAGSKILSANWGSWTITSNGTDWFVM